MKKGLHCYVSGRVQGVFFRSETQQQAILYGLTGWAKNLPDGRVEVLAFGEEEQLAQLRAWLKNGPGMAKVLKLEFKFIEYEEFDNFTIDY